jgi:hypothetical protein
VPRIQPATPQRYRRRPAEVEAVLLEHHPASQAAVIAWLRELGEHPTADPGTGGVCWGDLRDDVVLPGQYVVHFPGAGVVPRSAERFAAMYEPITPEVPHAAAR